MDEIRGGTRRLVSQLCYNRSSNPFLHGGSENLSPELPQPHVEISGGDREGEFLYAPAFFFQFGSRGRER